MDEKKVSNMELWDRFRTPPEDALRPIKAGRLKGKTDIDPVWRLEKMTEELGPCGSNWGYSIDKLWTEPGAGGEVAAFAQVTLWALAGPADPPGSCELCHSESLRPSERSPVLGGPVGSRTRVAWNIPGIGGSMLIQKERSGLHTNDEAYKMAVTDALSVAMKALGMAADVYRGRMDESKYGANGRHHEGVEAAGTAIAKELLEGHPALQDDEPPPHTDNDRPSDIQDDPIPVRGDRKPLGPPADGDQSSVPNTHIEKYKKISLRVHDDRDDDKHITLGKLAHLTVLARQYAEKNGADYNDILDRAAKAADVEHVSLLPWRGRKYDELCQALGEK